MSTEQTRLFAPCHEVANLATENMKRPDHLEHGITRNFVNFLFDRHTRLFLVGFDLEEASISCRGSLMKAGRDFSIPK